MEKIVENRQCKNCGRQFEITDRDVVYYNKIKVLRPTFCPDCRQQRRLAIRNENNLFYRSCDLCKKKIVSLYHPSIDLRIYCPQCWWSDRWDAADYARDFDFSRPFFEQFSKLKKVVPHISLYVVGNENSDYVNMTAYCKNCYLLFAADFDEDCLYGTEVVKCRNCVDTLDCFESENCYEAVDVHKSYGLLFSQNCRTCRDSMFLYDCGGCNDCLFCSNLRNKSCCIFNTQCTKEEYEAKKNEILKNLNSGDKSKLFGEFDKLKREAIYKNLEQRNNENSVGSYLFDSKNCVECYDLTYGEDCKYVYTGFKARDVMDLCHLNDIELCYEGVSYGFGSYNALFSNAAWSARDVQYCEFVQSSSDLFGCISMKRKQFCILNKQYTKEQYKELRSRIIEYMKKTGEYGEFFPISLSPLAYNESLAYEYFPLVEEEAVARGFKWRDPDKRDYQALVYNVPANIESVEDGIVKEILGCNHCGKNYRITESELKFYRRYMLPVPLKCPVCRHRVRMGMRNPRKVVSANCYCCNKSIKTSRRINESPKIYCEECYLKEVY